VKCSAHFGVTAGNPAAYSTVLFLTLRMKGYRYFVTIYGKKFCLLFYMSVKLGLVC